MFSLKQLSRYRAASIHLGISAAIAVITVTLMLALWYPPPLFGAMGGKELILLIVGVDVAIGPLITLIVFDPRKKELAFDLSIVALLQVSALIYGVYAMHTARPVYIAFVEGHFAVVSAASLEKEALASARPEFRSLPESGPTLVAVDMPADISERNNIVFASLGGLGAQHLPKYYVPYAERTSEVLAAAKPLDKLTVAEPEQQGRLQEAIADLHRPQDEIRFLPMVTERFSVLTALIDARTGALLATVAAKPLASGGLPVVPKP